MGCPETHERVRNQLCWLHYCPSSTRGCQFERTCNKHFARWLATEPEVQRLHKEYMEAKTEKVIPIERGREKSK